MTGVLTEAESTFRNAKLRDAALVLYKAFADVAGKGSLFVITVVAARRLSPFAFGVFGLGTTIGWMVAVTADFGVQMHLARAVAQQPDAADALLRRWWRFRLMATAAALAAAVAGFVVSRVDAAMIVPLTIFAIVYACTGLVDFLNYYYRGLSRSDLESTLTLWQRGGTLVLGLGVLVWRPDVTALALAMLVPVLAALAWSARQAARLRSHDRDARASRLRSHDRDARASAWQAHPSHEDRFLRDVFPIGLGIVLSAIYFRVDVLLVERWAGTEAVAAYNAVFRLIDALRLFPAAVLAVVLPRLCRAGDLRPLARVSVAVTAFAAAVSIVLWTTAGFAIPFVFGARYANAAPAFRVLALAFPLLSLNFALTHQLVAWNRERAYAVIAAAALAVNLGLNAWLIPAFSIAGAAWATFGTELCVTTGCVVSLLVKR